MPQLVVGNALRAAVRKMPQKTAFVFKDHRITYKAFNERVNRLANGLLAEGHQPGDHIAILAFNCIEYYEILFAVAKAGMVAVPVNFRFQSEEISYIINHSDSSVLIYEAHFREALLKVRRELEKIGSGSYIVFGGDGEPGDVSYEELIAGSHENDPDIDVSEDTTWYFGYTSGTTGMPKGALRSHRANILIAANDIYIREDDVLLLIMPIFHTNSLAFGLISVYQGATTVIYPSGGFDPREILEIIDREKVTFSSLVPTMFAMIMEVPDKENFETRSLRKVLTSSAPLMTKTKEQILDFFQHAQFFEGYGATELGGVTTLHPKDQERKLRSCGKANPFTIVKILDADGNECSPGEVGELYAISPGMFEGYYKQPEADAKAFRGDFLTVGDMVKVDDEGFYYLVDRKNDMIISGGENIYPTEIDDLLAAHPKVLEVAVIGVPDEKWGEAVKAVIVCKPGEDLTEKEVIDYCKQHLAGYKCPKSVDFWDSLPLNPMGKILKREIREKYWEGYDVKL
ncbi:class I adenylate-forming enzyme family protein [Thermodesulfobacteriota bacterium]